MTTKRILGLLIVCALGGLVGCGDDDTGTGTDSGMSGTDSSMPGDDGSTPGEDSSTPGDDGSTPTTADVRLTCTGTAPTATGECVTMAPTPPAAAGCPALSARTEVMVSADITADTTWSCDNLYILTAPIYVSAVLTVQPGTVVEGSAGANALVVTTSGRLEAEGTATDPIVFTSNNAENNRAPGDWGGVVLLGTAPINVPGGTNNIEGLDPGESRGQYGGTDASHDCGTLKYVRIEWAGFLFGEDNELNGLTIGGCGSDTVLDFVQVHGGLDDGIEFFGGTANLTHAVITSVGDDNLDTDQGYSGKVQFLIAQQDGRGDRTIEADNLEDNENVTPRSTPQIWNATFVGASGAEQQAFRLRRGTAASINNAIVTGFGMQQCARIDGTASVEQAISGDLEITSTMMMECKDMEWVRFTADEGDTTAPDDALQTAWCEANYFGVDPMLPADATNLDAPDFMPPAGSP
ncbi:MAG: hypothetical protein KDC14_15855, partial [Planctomycetes bacterium]|nr:hypothetical protein [Planctomycetota bacterium]